MNRVPQGLGDTGEVGFSPGFLVTQLSELFYRQNRVCKKSLSDLGSYQDSKNSGVTK